VGRVHGVLLVVHEGRSQLQRLPLPLQVLPQIHKVQLLIGGVEAFVGLLVFELFFLELFPLPGVLELVVVAFCLRDEAQGRHVHEGGAVHRDIGDA